MKRKFFNYIIPISCILVIFVSFILLINFHFYTNKLYALRHSYNINKVNLISVPVKNSVSPLFKAKLNNNKLCIYLKNQKNIYQMFNIDIISLPEADKNMLENGIDFYTTSELNSFLEDYSE